MFKALTIMTFSAILLATPAMAAGDGSQVRERLQAGKGEHGGKGAQMLMKLDTDGDGAVSKAEFMAGTEARFTKMDRNGDGKISKEDRPEGGGRGGPGAEGGAVVPNVTTE
jgi:EF-hand domain pair